MSLVLHPRHVDPFPKQGNGSLLVLKPYSLSDGEVARGDGVERIPHVQRRLFDMNREHVALGDRDGARRIETVSHADRILHVLSRRFEDLVRDDSLRCSPLSGAKKDQPHGDGKDSEDGGEGEENQLAQGH